MAKHELKIEVSDSVWVAVESRAKEENTDALNLIKNFIEKAIQMEFGEALPNTDIDKEDDTPV